MNALLIESIFTPSDYVEAKVPNRHPCNVAGADLILTLASGTSLNMSAELIEIRGMNIRAILNFTYTDGNWKLDPQYTFYSRAGSNTPVSTSARQKIHDMFLETLNNIFKANVHLFDDASNIACGRKLSSLNMRKERLQQELLTIEQERNTTIAERAKDYEMFKELMACNPVEC